jgi:hypothetical protein
MIVEDRTSTPLSFDFGRDYEAEVLVYESYGGGIGAVEALRHMRLRRHWAKKVRARLEPLQGFRYVAAHVRNSDLKSDYLRTFAELAERLRGRPLVVCSDDQSVLDFAHSYFVDSPVFTPSTVGHRNGRPFQIPFVEGTAAREKIALDTLVDLFALSGSSELFCAPVMNRTDSVSGFSILAEKLRLAPNLRLDLLRIST